MATGMPTFLFLFFAVSRLCIAIAGLATRTGNRSVFSRSAFSRSAFSRSVVSVRLPRLVYRIYDRVMCRDVFDVVQFLFIT